MGVNTPVFMPPMMMMGMSMAQKARAVARRRSFTGRGWPWGRSMPRSTQRHAKISPAPIIKPGTMPDTNSAEIDVLVVTP